MPSYEFDRTNLDGDQVVNSITYEPNGVDHRLQRRITELLDRIALEEGKWTLAELGYLHINTLLYDRETGRVNLKVYFDVHYAARVRKDPVTSKKQLLPVSELKAFENRLFYGPLMNVVSFETIMAPKSKMVEDEMKRPSISFKDDAKFVETECLVLNCNLPITMAAVHDINLTDPQFKVKCTTVGKGSKTKEKSILTSGNRRFAPVQVTVTAGQLVDDDGNALGFDPDDCRAYLTALQEQRRVIEKNRSKLEDKARDKAEKPKKSKHIGFNKYS